MTSTTEIEVDLFGDQLPSLDELKILSGVVNSSEINQIAFAEQVEKRSADKLAAGIGLAILGKNTEVVKSLTKAKDCVEKFLYLGYAQRKLEAFDDAISSFTEAEKLNADSLMVALEKAETLRTAKRLEETQKQLDSCSNFEKVSAEYHFQLGKLKDAQGFYEEAMVNYEIAIELDPLHQKALFQLAYSHDLRGNDEAAIDYYTQVKKNTPVYVNTLLNIAVLYEDKGEYDKAEICVEMILTAHPNHKKADLFGKDIRSSRTMIYDEEKEKLLSKQSQILEIPISDFELSVRSRNCLKKMNIYTIGDLLRINDIELLSYKNFGETSLTEIKKILHQKGLELGMALQEELAIEDMDEANEELLSRSVDDLKLTVRARRCLTKLDINSIGELVSKTEAELLGCKNFGVTSLNEIREQLKTFGLSLRKLE